MNKSVTGTELWRYPEKLIPSDWSVLQLKKVTKKIADRDHTTPKYVSSEIGVPIVSPTNLNSQMRLDLSKLKYITKEAHEKNRKKTDLLPEDIIFSRIGAGLGKSYLLDNSFYDFSILHSFCQIRVDDNVIPQYLLWFLRCDYLQWRLKFGIQSIGVPDLGLGEIGELPIFFPNQKIEQQKIAQILTSVDEVIEKTQAQIDKLKDLKTAMMQELLTKGIGHLEFKDSPVGRIPVGWEVVTMREVTKVIDSLHLTPTFSTEGLPMVRVSDIREGKVNLDKTKKVSEDVFEQFTKNHRPMAGDLLMSRVGSYGVCCYVDKDTPLCIGQNTVVIVPNSINYLYLFYCINSSIVQKQIEFEVAGSGYKSLSLASIRELKLILPSVDEQIKIAKSFESIDNKIEVVKSRLASVVNTKKALMQDLLTGEVRVNTELSNPSLAVG
tara:strand:+ start:1065 stop:2378 length:1314 start_codon:yes stop_codon:yes gene_type:complete